MSSILPQSFLDAVDAFGQLPGVGARTAERYAAYLLRAKPRTADIVAQALADLHAGVKVCPRTYALIDAANDMSPLYTDKDRDKKQVAIVEEPLDIVAIERTNQYKGTYHVLGGVISPLDGVTPADLHIPELLARLSEDEVEEVIIATNASVEGESTALFIQRQITEAGISAKLTRLARGIPAGIDLEYADQITLQHALEGRRVL